VIGSGFIGPVHVEALRRLGRPVVGLLGSTPERGRSAADALSIPRAYQDLAELLADPAVNVVHVTSPNRYHFDQCRKTLEAGKHVVCEKPLAMNSAETARLVELADRSGVIAAVNYNVRFYPLCLEVRQRIASGAAGPVYHVAGSYLQDWLLFDTDFNWRVLPETGGELRAVADIGTHWLDLITFVTGLEIEAVCADLATVIPTRQRPTGGVATFQSGTVRGSATEPVAIPTEDYGSVLLRFRGGSRGAFTVSQVTAGRKNRLTFDVAAARTAYGWDSEQPNTLHVGYRDRPNEALVRDPALIHPSVARFADYPGGHAEGFPDTFKQLFRAVYGAIDGENEVYPTFADGHREVVICEAINRSHREGKWITV
jgi:predicted dehydrogenase